MSENPGPDPLPGLPEELAALDRELLDLRISERASFAPELQAELEKEWLRGPRSVSRSLLGRRGVRRWAAAAAVAVTFAGLSVPPARAALAELSRQALVSVGVLERAEPAAPVVQAPLAALLPEETTGPDAPGDPSGGAGSSEDGAASDEAESAAEVPAFSGMSATLPRLVDRAAEEEAIRRHYPEDLQRRGVGGTVSVYLWVDSLGQVDLVNMRKGSGVPKLDRAALRAVDDLRFVPATRGGVPVGTWVEFDLVFEPPVAEESLPTVGPLAQPDAPDLEGLELDAWSPEAVVSPPVNARARTLLGAALSGRPAVLERLGSLESLLRGVPPAGVSPLGWRADAMDALERALARDPDNPAPYLALGRILTKQGLGPEALRLFERGLARAERGVRPASAELIADLQYERGMLLKERWLAWRSLGTLTTPDAEGPRCARAGDAADPTSPESLIAVNFLCPREMERWVGRSFRPSRPDADTREEMLAAFESAVEAVPGHVGANIELLLDMADEERWYEMLNAARRFAWASRGHPHALLLSAMALQRMGRSEEALEEFQTAFRTLPEQQLAALRDVHPLMTDEAEETLADLDGDEWSRAVRTFWRRLDPILATEVNEREVEHLARATYALLRFGGTDTDAGELWIRYGAPLTVRTVGAGTDLRTELWDYGRAPYVTFRRPAMSAALELTPEARAFIDDLRHVFPHRYGSRARRVYTLPATMSRFRTPDGGSEVEIRTVVPEELRVSSHEPVELGLYTLGPDGDILSDTTQSVEGRDIRVRAPAPPGAATVVLEVYNRQEGEAASARIAVPRGVGQDESSLISDVLLVEAADPPERAVSRRDAWIHPLPFGGVSSDRIGAVFELYDVPDDGAPYRIRVEAVPASGSESVVLPHRPAGQRLFGPSWSRLPLEDEGPVTEYLTLDVGDLAPGTYTLRVAVDVPGQPYPLISTIPFERTVADAGGDGS